MLNDYGLPFTIIVSKHNNNIPSPFLSLCLAQFDLLLTYCN